MSIPLNERQKLFASTVGQDIYVIGMGEGTNMGLNFCHAKLKRGELKFRGVRVFFPKLKKAYVIDMQIVKTHKHEKLVVNTN